MKNMVCLTKFSGRAVVLAAAGALSLPVSIFGQSGSRTWTGSVSTDFYDGANWSAAGDFPNGNVTFNDASLTGAANTTIDRASGTYLYVYQLFFNNTSSAQNSYTINGPNRFFVGGPSIQTAAVASGNLTDVINTDIQKAGDAETFNIRTNHDLIVNGNVFGGTTSTTKSGGGTLFFNGANSYPGATLVNAGTLALAGSHTGAGAYTIADGATLDLTGGTLAASQLTDAGTGTVILNNSSVRLFGAGTSTFNDGVSLDAGSEFVVENGTVAGAVDVDGIFGVGLSQVIETANLDGLTLNTGSTYHYSLNGDPGVYDYVDDPTSYASGNYLSSVQSDLLTVDTLTLNGLITVELNSVGVQDVTPDQEFVLFNIDNGVDVFNLPWGTFNFVGGQFTTVSEVIVSVKADAGPAGQDLIVISLAAKSIPEPSSVMLLGVGAVLLMRMKRGRSRIAGS